jgi:septal ring factor EnvC (AmiA/AmiB activator)
MPQKSSIEQTLETLVDLVDLQRKHADRDFSKLTASLEALALNVGQLAGQQKQTAANLDKVGDRIDRLTAAIERQNNAIDGHLSVAQAQAVNIAELTRLATRLIDRVAG